MNQNGAVVILWLTGLYFIFTAGLKAISPLSFLRHLQALEILSERALKPLCAALIAIPFGLGLALCVQVSLAFVLLAALVWTAAGLLLTFWSHWHKGLQDCGCYGPVRGVPLGLSLSVHFFLLMGLVSLIYSGYATGAGWQLFSVTTLGLVVVCAALFGWVYKKIQNQGLSWDVSELQESWKRVGLTSEYLNGVLLVLYFTERCYRCLRWISIFNVIHAAGKEPQVIGICPEKESGVVPGRSARRNQSANFPVYKLPLTEFHQHINRAPTVFQLRDREVRARWQGQIPTELKNIYYTLMKETELKSKGGV